MAKVLTETPITTRNARGALPAGLYWRQIDPETHLGYRKGKRAGVWLVRWRDGNGYRQAPLGTADDALKAGTLTYDAAMKAARIHVENVRSAAIAKADGPSLTVSLALDSYIAVRNARASRRAGQAKRSDAASRLSRYVIGYEPAGRRAPIAAAPIADIALHLITEKDLANWRAGLPDGLKATTTRRLINDFKAALNAAYASDREHLPPTLPGVIKHALRAIGRDEEAEPVARDNQILSDGEIAGILQAAREVDEADGWEGDLFRLVLVLAATGARFSQVARLRVRDFQPKEARLLIPVSRKGRGGAKVHFVTSPIGPDVVTELVPIAVRREGDAPLLERWRFVQVAPTEWKNDRRGAWQSASEIVRPWRAIRARAGLPDVVPYSLRHSSIVRAIRANLPLRLIAATHDTSTAMIERHYAKWITSGLEEMVRAAIVPLVPDEGAKIVRIAGRNKS